MNLRLLCFNILKKVEGGSFVQNELKMLDGLNGRDAAFVTQLVKGVVRNRLKLERRIAAASSRAFSGIDPDTLIFLLIGAYQLEEMDRVPSYAAVNETVKAMKSLKMHKTLSFVNGILRTISKGKAGAVDYADEAERLSVEYSVPPWLVERWSKQYDSDHLEIILKEMNSEPLTNIFVNRNKILLDDLIDEFSLSNVKCEKNEFFDDMLTIVEGRAADTDAFKRGCFYIQDTASRLVAKVVSLIADTAESSILDAAAAPGGKSINLLCDGYDVISSDISRSKLIVTKENLQRMGLNENRLIVLDAEMPLPFSRRFRIILLDAPCSACGRIRRAPEIKYRLKPEDFNFLSEQQLRLLSNTSDYVEDGGYLVYATCSVDESEDENVIEKFLENKPAFALIDPRSFSENRPVLNEITDDRGFIRTDNLLGKMDGFFIAVMKKVKDSGSFVA
jgi:16S rRNA (cytosine967-C5)-methyltransferase